MIYLYRTGDGVNFYEQVRATLVAEDWGYAAFAADIYGKDLHEVPDLQQRGQLATFYRENPEIFAERIKAAIDEFSALPGVDGDNIVVMGKFGVFCCLSAVPNIFCSSPSFLRDVSIPQIKGYCFGGTGVLQYSLLGYTNVKGIISFHGGLPFVLGTEPDVDDANEMLPKVLVLSGGDDDAGSDIVSLEEKLNGISNTWEITRYSGIEHAFTVWDDSKFDNFIQVL
jgi:dienelactone hydrolase